MHSVASLISLLLLAANKLLTKDMQPTTIVGLLAFLASFCVFATSKPTSTGHYHHGTDIVTEILQAIDRREEMWRIATYLNASRDDLLNELPYLNAGKMSFFFFFS